MTLGQWSVRISQPGGERILGAGVYLGQGLILTCAHVVGDALGLSTDHANVPQEQVSIDFPGLAAGRWISAGVMDGGWWPAGQDRRGDAAVLKLSGPAPQDALAAPLAADCHSGDFISAYGYPDGFDDGVHASAAVAGRTLTTGWFQLEDERQAGERVQPGFSGAGAELQDGSAVIGIIAWAAKRNSGSRMSWLLPITLLAQHLPAVREALARSSISRRRQGAQELDDIGTRCPLPADLPDFTGRSLEIDKLHQEYEGNAVGPAIHVLTGMGGIGKTRLAVHLAHQLAAEHADGQHFIDLQAHSAGKNASPLTTQQALISLLSATIGKPPNTGDIHRLATMWRDVLHRRSLVVILDNATSYAQIKELLPQTPGSLILITSRRILTELGADGGIVKRLNALDEDSSVQLFASIVGEERAAAEPEEVRKIVRLCGHLPLAIRIKASFADVRQGQWTLAEVREDLEEERDRLDQLRLGDSISVRGAFATSYRHLGGPGQELFRRLALHPPGPMSHQAAAALMDDPAQAKTTLDELLAESLIEDAGRHRLKIHDLLREYARECLAQSETDHEQQRQPVNRLLTFYLSTALTAEQLLVPTRPVADQADTTPVWVPKLQSRAAALKWFQTEHPNLIGCSALAAQYGLTNYLWRIPRAMGPYLGLAAASEDATALYTQGLKASRGRNERAEADLRALMGDIYRITGPQQEALTTYRTAQAYYARIGDRIAVGDMLTRSSAAQRMSDLDGAIESCELALGEYALAGDDFGPAEAHYMLGMALRTKGDYPAALVHLGDSLSRYETIGYPVGQARCLALIGVVHRLTGDYDQAIDTLRQAEVLYRAAGDTRGIANTVNNLASALGLAGRINDAVAIHGEALTLFRRSRSFGYPDAQMVGADLLSKQGNHRAAEELLRETIGTFQSMQARLGEARAHLLLSVALLGQDRADKALVEAEDSLRLYESIANAPGQAAARKAVSNCRNAPTEGAHKD
ncbi:tetratricopeptide repeat protein [Streptomyces niveus]|uniref:tetratricopeptide repeat protein n=1 Tax=Streptomyces niveus TaxID=193462 RepID=UPI0036D43395